MKPAKILRIAFNMVKANKLRSWLTIVGVIIGIASVMAIVTTGEYFQEQVTKTMEDLGGDTITIVASYPFNFEDVEYSQESISENESGGGYGSPGTYEEPKNPELTRKDVFTLRRIPGVQYINVNVETFADLEFGGKKTSVYIRGVDPGVWPDITKKKVGEGRMLQPGDRTSVVIANELANDEALGRQIRVNQMILLNGKSYRVIGILAKDGGLLGALGGFGNSIFMPYEEIYSLSTTEEGDNGKKRNVYDSIEVKLYKNADYEGTLKEMEEVLRLSRRVDEKTQDFYVYSGKENMESVGKVISGLTAFLAFIAGISLLVGSTGIANTMFTSVLEKTKEIGIMKAIGAQNKDIMLIFLCNAAMISLVGGIIGILLGTAVVQAILFLISMKMQTPFEFALSIKGTIIATLVSIIVGLIAGLVPAKNASELKPVDALRYE
ncbi:ABC transporter permease [Methanosarcina sp. 2.H.T.1A.6]|uniref:ABC transporter permease n=1 Tax=unclassified Methanosarcina TaxID=2644672 RepID=UPI000621AC04|nr:MULTISPECIES: ABC transporter permease [unclassified Methanosarcina]KKG16896.1 ABC transporter permease [Methanosarcina sp. 2.H.T.1A.3]KKG20431.1 ABC transporter permease [Methanosarcina sp. 2.H.T.1A.8]KKG21327.1 ABC transporter permease [Methanosarcina sp. 2.H.T.1A.15]KKG22516.1 ABC transporter permease [Methanosarcina sp. 2.H.T.1A.6]